MIDTTDVALAQQRQANIKREHDAALAEFRSAERQRSSLDGRLTDEHGRRIVEVDGETRYLDDIDDIELRVLRSRCDAFAQQKAEALWEARQRLRVVNVDAANDQLPGHVEIWRQAAEDQERCRVRAEQTYGAAIAAMIELGRATVAERMAARHVQGAASAGLPDDSGREALRGLSLTRQVATMLDRDGPCATADRPDRGVFDSENVNAETFGRLLAFAYADPDRCEKQLLGTLIGRAAGITPKTAR